MFNKMVIFLMCFFTLNAFAGNTGFSPTSLKIKVYKFAVSTSPYCTNLITVIDNGITPVEVEFVGGVDLGSGVLADGTYPCVVIEMSDNIKFNPNGTSLAGHCVPSTQVTNDICRTDNNGSSVLVAGSAIACAGTDASPSADRVALYLSTISTQSNNSFLPPTVGTPGNGLTLSSSLVVSGTSVGQFKVDASLQVADDGTYCGLDAPVFSFSKL